MHGGILQAVLSTLFHPQAIMSHACPVCAGVRRALDGDAGPHMIVAPASLLQNWQRELQRWCPGLKAVLYYGKERGRLRERLSAWRCVTDISAGIGCLLRCLLSQQS